MENKVLWDCDSCDACWVDEFGSDICSVEGMDIKEMSYCPEEEMCEDCGNLLEDCDCEVCTECGCFIEDCMCEICDECGELATECSCE